MADATPTVDAKRVGPLELFFDLVFVFALTQVTARLADDLSLRGLGRGLLVLAAIWWAWAAYAWLTNEVDGRRVFVRLAIVASMTSMLVASLAIPGAFEDRALLFALAYLGVRLLHVALFVAGTDDVDVRHAARALAPTALMAPALLLAAAVVPPGPREAVWVLALLVDYIGAGLRGIEGWRLSPGHFGERHGLIVIIALGESIVAIGVGAEEAEHGAAQLLAAALGMVVAAALWWAYFDDSLDEVEHRLHALPAGRPRNTTARDAYSFLHLPLVAGIVLLALGVKKTLEHVAEPLPWVAAVGLCGGAVLFFLADAAFRTRTLGSTSWSRVGAAVGCALLMPVAVSVPAVAALGCLAVVCAALVALEAVTGGRLPRPRRPSSPTTGSRAAGGTGQVAGR